MRHGKKKALVLAAAAAATMGVFTLPEKANAATRTWNGASASSSNFSDTANWAGNAIAPGDLLIFSGSTRLTPVNNFAAGTLTPGIQFNSTAGAFSITGVSISLQGDITSASSNNESLGLSVSFTSGTHAIGTTGTGVLSIGTLSRSQGATVQFTSSTGNINVTGASSSLTSGVLTLGGTAFATSGASDWASSDGSNNIIALTSYNTSSDPSTWLATDNLNLSSDIPGTIGSKTVNSVKFGGGANFTLNGNGSTLTVTTGGILMAPGAAASSINGEASTTPGGFLKGSGGTNRELVIIQNSANALTISAHITDNTAATALTKTGSGQLILNASNAYTGPTNIVAGSVTLGAGANFGANTNALLLGGATTVASIDLGANNITVGTLSAVLSASSAANIISIGDGQTLNVSTVSMGTTDVGNLAQNSRITLKASTGNASFSETGAAPVMNIGTGTSSGGAGAAVTLDATGLNSFSLVSTGASASGTLAIGASNRSNGTLLLASGGTSTAGNLIKVGTITVGTNGTGNLGNGFLSLGTGTNTLNVGLILLADSKSNGTINFQDASNGTLKIRGYGGTDSDRAALTLGNRRTAGSPGNSAVNFGTHAVDAKISTLIVQSMSFSGTGSLNANAVQLSLGAGTIDVNDIQMAAKTAGGSFNNANTAGTISISGGSFIVNNSFSMANITAGGGTANLLSAVNVTGGTLRVGSNITQTGGTATSMNILLDGGTIDMGGGGTAHAIGSASGAITLTANSGTLTNVSEVNGGGAVTKSSTGVLTLIGTNSWTGDTNVNAGQLINAGLLASSANVQVNNGGTFIAMGSTGASVNVKANTGGIVAGTGNGTTTGVAGNLTLNTGGFIKPGASAAEGSVGTLAANTLTVNGGNFRLDLGATNDLINVIGTANFTAASSITPVFPGAVVPGTYTILTAGTLTGTAPTVGTGSASRVPYTVHFGDTVPNAITLDVGAGGAAVLTWVGGIDNGSGAFVWDVNTTPNWTSTATSGNPNTYYDQDTVTFDDSSTNKTVTLNTAVAPGPVIINSSGNYTFTGAGTISGDNGLTKSGTGAASILISNNYLGPTTLNGGTLFIGANQSTTGAAAINGGTMVVNASVAWSGALPVNGGTVVIGTGGTAGQLSNATINLSNGGNVTFNHSDDLSIGTLIAGSGSVIKNGAAKLTLNATNTYSGTTMVNAGTVLVTNAATTGSSLGQTTNGGAATFSPGSVLDLASTPAANGLNFGNKPFFVAGNGTGAGVIVNNGNSQQNVFRVIALTGDATFTANQVTDIRNNPTTSLGGTLTLNGNTLHKAGSSRMSLVGIDVTTGTIMVESGTLSIETASRLLADPNSAVIYQPNTIGAFFETTGTTTVNRQMVVNGSGVMFGPASSNLAAISSPIQLKGDLVVQNLTANQTGTLALLGNITEDGTPRKITKNGNGTGSSSLVLGGTNSFSGGLDINSGVVQLNSASALPSAGTVNLGSDTALLRLNGNSITVAGVNGGSSQAIIENASATPSTLTVNNTNDSNFGGIMRDGTGGGALSLLKSGAARLTLGGSNTYTGTTTISGGTIELSGNGFLAPSSNVVGSGAGGTLAFNRGDNITFTNSISGALNVYKQGGGQLTLPSTYSYTGSATLESGTVVVSGAFNPSGTTNITGATLSGAGTIGQTQMSGGSIHPGANANDGVIGTTTLSSLTVNGGELRFDLGPTSDLINVTGAAVFNGGNISVAGTPLPGTYTVLTAGALTLNTPPSVNQPNDPNNRPAVYTLNTSTANTLKLTVTGGPISITWTGANSGTWDIHTTQNWTSGSPDFFYNLDTVNFTESSSVRNVSLDTTVSPGNTIFSNSTGSYAINGGGQISGNGGVTINGGGTVFMNVNNNYTGTTAVQNGTLMMGSGKSNAIPNGSALVLGNSATSGVVDLNGNDININGLSTSGTGAANIIGNSSTSNDSRININGGVNTFAGVIQDVLNGGSRKLNVSLSNASETFTGNNTYSGQTQINSTAALQIGAGGNTGSFGASSVNNDGTLIFNRIDTVTISQDIGGGGKTVVNSGTVVVGNGATAGRLSSGAITNNGIIVLDRTDNLNIDNVITGTGALRKVNTNTVTITGSNGYSGGLVVNSGAVRLNHGSAAGTGPVTVNAGATLVNAVTNSASFTGALTLSGGTFGSTTSLNPVATTDVTATALTTSTIIMADPQNLPGGAQDVVEMNFTGNLHGSGTINVLSNGQDNNPDSGNGFRLRGTGITDFAGTVVLGNNVKGELQTGSVGLYSPAGTGKVIMNAGNATLAGTLTTQTTTGGYSELNLRNNSTGNATFGNDLEIAGAGLAVLNPLGNAPTAAIIGMGNLKIGAGQELGVYDASGNIHTVAFNSVTLTGGNATFSPRTANLGAGTSVGGDLALGNITELTAGSSITMSGTRTLTLTGSNSYTGGTNVSAGSLVTNSNFSNGPLTITGGKAVVKAKATNNDPTGTTSVPSIAISAGATLDLTNNSAVINYSTSPLTDIRGQLLLGYANGAWNGTGLTSSSAQAAASGAIKTAIGYTDSGTALMLKYTVSGDANLDGVTNALDFNALATNFAQPTGDRWNNGDFNYDGAVNTLDFNALAQNFNAVLPATPPPAPGLGSLVPEPASLATLGVLTVITRRRRHLRRA